MLLHLVMQSNVLGKPCGFIIALEIYSIYKDIVCINLLFLRKWESRGNSQTMNIEEYFGFSNLWIRQFEKPQSLSLD